MRRAAAILAILALGGCGSSEDPPPAPAGERAERSVATGLDVPWGVDFLPDGDALVAERGTARVLRIRAGRPPEPLMTVPGVDADSGEGGLLGLAVSPRYADDGLVYAYFTSPEDNRIVRFRPGGPVEVVVDGLEREFVHNGGRIAFGPDGKLYAGVGDAGDPSSAQDPESENGKILRMNPDGSVPADNPFPGSRVWSLGHRNVQGLAWDRADRLWATEFGQDEFDEVNMIRKGANYGWPEVEGEGDTQDGRFENPRVTWETAESSPSGAAIAGDDLYVAALRGERLWRIPIRDDALGEPVALLDGRLGRLRTVVRTPAGALWVATSNRDGRGTPRDGDDRILEIPAR